MADDADGVAFVRAATLVERLAAAGGPDRSAAASALERAGRELAVWRRRKPFDDERWWRTRLATGGVDEATLLALLAEPPDALHRRLGSAPWIGEMVDDLLGDTPLEERESYPDAPLAQIVAPLLRVTRERLVAGLTRLASPHPDAFDAAVLADQLYRPLPALVQAMLSRSMALEINVDRAEGRLCGADPRERFGSFIARWASSAGRRELFHRYPVLGRRLSTLFRRWTVAALRVVQRALDDRAQLAAVFAGGRDLGRLTEVTTGLGDRHRGETVALLRWSGGLRVVYKPRSLAVDRHYQELLRWINAQAAATPFRTLSVLDRGRYGWAEFVDVEPCVDEAARRRFYHRQGGLLAVHYLLCGTDVHAENILAAGDQPVAVDLESLLQPALPVAGAKVTTAERMVGDASRGSVLNVGLLPETGWLSDDGVAVDISGLGQSPGQRTPHGLPVLTGVGTDDMRIQLERVELPMPHHRPVPDETPLSLLSYASEITAGFREVYEIFLGRRATLAGVGGPLMAFAGDEVRVLRQGTAWYATVLQTSFHPDALGDGLAHERHLDALWRTAGDVGGSPSCIAPEQADLWVHDIPVFTAGTDSRELRDSRGEPVPNVVLVPGLDRARHRLAQLSADDLERQLWLIRASLSTTAISASRAVLTAVPRAENAAPLAVPGDGTARERLIATADRIGHRLGRHAFESDDSVQWLGLYVQGAGSWGLGALLPEIFHGLCGVALFYAWLGRLTGEARHTRLARKALVTLRAQLARQDRTPCTGMAGTGGVVYVLAALGELWGEDDLFNAAAGQLDRDGDALRRDTGFDFVVGNAGAIAGALFLHERRPADRILDHVAAATARLAQARVDDPEGTGWLAEGLRAAGSADRPIAGFSHGVGGISWTLFEAAAALDAPAVFRLASRALAYEQARFLPDLGYWRDERMLHGGELATADLPESGWCYGAMGIGLSRALSLRHMPGDPLIRAEIEAALTATRQQPLGLSHCLCHGDLGNSELLLQTAAALGDPTLRAQALDRAVAVLDSIAAGGLRCGTPLNVQTPSLMVGLAGIGYGLLRAARPELVPAVLMLRGSDADAGRS